MSKYGCITGVHRSIEMPVAASQKFNRTGGAFVIQDSAGNIRLALTADATICGFAIVPLGIGSGLGTDAAVWQSSATAGADRLPVIVNLSAEFLVPADDTVTQAMCGDGCDLIGVNDGTKQTADVGTGANDVLLVEKLGTAAGGSITDVVVRMNPSKMQIAN